MSWKGTSFLAGAIAIMTGPLSGCGAINKTRAQDMNVRGHEEAAAIEDARAKQGEMAAMTGGRGSGFARATALSHRRLADEHRAAAVALHDEEAKACAGVPADAVARAAFGGATIRAVNAIEEPRVRNQHNAPGYFPISMSGARFRLDGDLAAPDVERMLGCRIAHAAAMGDDGIDPVGVPGASARVLSGEGRSLTVELRASEGTAAAEVLRRARALASR
jgi:hypothetical protein